MERNKRTEKRKRMGVGGVGGSGVGARRVAGRSRESKTCKSKSRGRSSSEGRRWRSSVPCGSSGLWDPRGGTREGRSRAPPLPHLCPISAPSRLQRTTGSGRPRVGALRPQGGPWMEGCAAQPSEGHRSPTGRQCSAPHTQRCHPTHSTAAPHTALPPPGLRSRRAGAEDRSSPHTRPAWGHTQPHTPRPQQPLLTPALPHR